MNRRRHMLGCLFALALPRVAAAAPPAEEGEAPKESKVPVDLSDPGERAPGAEREEIKARVGVNAVGDVVGESEYATTVAIVDGVPTIVRKKRPDVGGSLVGIVTPIPTWHGTFGPGLGVTMKLLYRPLGREDRSPPSSTTPFAIAWLKFSWVVGIDQRLYLKHDRWRVHVLTHGGRYNLSYKALGPAGDGVDYRDNSFLARALVWRKLVNRLYFGVGWWFRFADYQPENSASEAIIRSANFGLDHSRSSGPTAELAYDSRDDQFAASSGHYVVLGGDIFPTQLGSTTNHARLRASYAGYVSPVRPLVIAGRLRWQSAFGDTPLATLPRYGGAGDSRGYQPGRFVGRHRATGQIEFRWTIKEPWGLVFFGEIGTVFFAPENWQAERWSQLILPSGGVGLRYRPSPFSRLNLRADIVISRYGPFGLLLGLGEAF